MFTAYSIFKKQIKLYPQEDLCRSPFSYFFRWRRSLKPGHSSISDEQPWITFEAIAFLEKEINANWKIFEYGGGGSTLFFARHGAETITVEHDRNWFSKLSEIVSAKKYSKWSGKFIEPVKGDLLDSPDPSVPEHYSSLDPASKGFNFQAYASAIDSYPDAYFDLVVVDGRARPSCIHHAIPKIKAGGYLLVDNSDRDYYFSKTGKEIDKHFKRIIHSFGPSPYCKDFTKTSIWKKVKA